MVPLTRKIKICCHLSVRPNGQQQKHRYFTVGQALRKATGRTEFGRFLNLPDTALNSGFKITDSTKNVKKHLAWLMRFRSENCR